MLRYVAPFVLATTAWLALADSAQACAGPKISAFALADHADTVALGRIVALRRPTGTVEGRATVAVDEVIEGAGTRLVVRFGNTSCDPHLRRARTPVLVFLDADGTLTGNYQGVDTSPDPTLLAALRRWSGLGAAQDRVDFLVEAMKGADAELATHAMLFARAAKAGFDETQLATLQAEAAAVLARRFDAELAARYGRPSTDFAANDFSAITDAKRIADAIASSSDDALRFEAYEQCGLLHGRVWHVLGPVDDAAWAIRAKNCETGIRDVDLELAAIHSLPIADFEVHDFETETSATTLADTMESAVRGGRFAQAMKAYERCWRLHGIASDPRDIPWWFGGLLASDPLRAWRPHVTTCRTGSPYSS